MTLPMPRLSAALAAPLLFVSPAAAQAVVCGDGAMMLASLATRYGETPLIRGVVRGGLKMVITVNAETGSFTILSFNPAGLACMRAAGDGFALDTAPMKPKTNL